MPFAKKKKSNEDQILHSIHCVNKTATPMKELIPQIITRSRAKLLAANLLPLQFSSIKDKKITNRKCCVNSTRGRNKNKLVIEESHRECALDRNECEMIEVNNLIASRENEKNECSKIEENSTGEKIQNIEDTFPQNLEDPKKRSTFENNNLTSNNNNQLITDQPTKKPHINSTSDCLIPNKSSTFSNNSETNQVQLHKDSDNIEQAINNTYEIPKKNLDQLGEANSPEKEEIGISVTEYLRKEIWKKSYLHRLQQEIITSEANKLEALKNICSNIYKNIFEGSEKTQN